MYDFRGKLSNFPNWSYYFGFLNHCADLGRYTENKEKMLKQWLHCVHFWTLIGSLRFDIHISPWLPLDKSKKFSLLLFLYHLVISTHINIVYFLLHIYSILNMQMQVKKCKNQVLEKHAIKIVCVQIFTLA